MKQAFEDVARFHAISQIAKPGKPTVPLAKEGERAVLERLATELEFAETQLKGEGATVAAKRVRLMASELQEIIDAMLKDDLHEFADAIADLCYVVIGTADEASIPLPAVWAEVQRANMTKFPVCEACSGSGKDPKFSYRPCFGCGGNGHKVLRDAGGKIMKPEGWTPPDHTAALGPNPKKESA